MTTFAIIQARFGSSRLPGKVLRPLGGKPLLAWSVQAAGRIPGVDKVIVATSDAVADDAIVDWCAQSGVACRRGHEDDVLARFVAVLRAERAEPEDIVLRLTADCPFLDPVVCGEVLALRAARGADYASNCLPASFPDGLDCEAFTVAALHEADRKALRPSDREHVTPYIRGLQDVFTVVSATAPIPGLAAERWTVDDARDFAFVEAVVAAIGEPVSYLDILALLSRQPDLRRLNAQTLRNEGYAASRKAEPYRAIYGHARSQALLAAAEKRVPLASQTFSKAHIQYPEGAAPLFLTHGSGGRVWDVDGNDYVDLVMGLLSVTLGYGDPDVDDAVRHQLNRGISFSLATDLELRLADMMAEMVPCAEQVRFGKNGSDATTGCVRIARAYTGRERVVVCGYHGWHDWYIGATTRNLGVPVGASNTTHMLPTLDPEALDRLLSSHPGAFAAVVMEPMNVVRHPDGLVADIKAVTHRHGALLVFDEVITGFRFAAGGAQEMYGVTPDLAAFGKGMGNGMPISAVVGPARLMKTVEDIFFSSTFGGEALSLAASVAVLDKIRREPVIETLAATGLDLAARAEALIAQNGLSETIQLKGHASWKILAVSDHPAARKEAIKTLFLREMLARGVLINASHNICYAHSAEDMDRVISAYDETLAIVAAELETGSLESRLGIKPIEPIFKVR